MNHKTNFDLFIIIFIIKLTKKINWKMKLISSKRVLYLFGFVLLISSTQATEMQNKDDTKCENVCQGKK